MEGEPQGSRFLLKTRKVRAVRKCRQRPWEWWVSVPGCVELALELP